MRIPFLEELYRIRRMYRFYRDKIGKRLTPGSEMLEGDGEHEFLRYV